MESRDFDALVRETYKGATRRGVVRVGVGALAASALASLGLGVASEAKKKKKKKKKNRCKGNRPVKCGNGCCPSSFSQCCENATDPVNTRTCNPPDFTCCSLDDGGGSCPPDVPQCCPPTTQDPFGSCAEADAVCCTSEEGGSFCPSGTLCCVAGENFAGCCEALADCCQFDDDCDSGEICDFGCCVPEVLASSGRRARASRKGGTERFYKTAK